MTQSRPTSKYHHFRPVLHLRGFAVDDRVWVYDRQGECEPVQRNVRKIGGERFLYAPDDNRRDDQIEVWLAQEIDDPAAAALRKLATGTPISGKERSRTAAYLGVQDMRTPKVRDFLIPLFQRGISEEWSRMTADRKQLRDDIRRATGTDYTDEELAFHIQTHSVEVNKGVWLDFLLRNVNVAGKRIYRMSWRMVKAPDNYTFLTNDVGIVKFAGSFEHPVPFVLGFAAARSHWLVPLSRSWALALEPSGKPANEELVEARPAWIKAINRQLVTDADRFVYSARFHPFVLKWWGSTRPAA